MHSEASSSLRRFYHAPALVALCALAACSTPTPNTDAGDASGNDATADGAITIEPVCPPPSNATSVVGDFNGDQQWDIADSIAFSNWFFRAGRAPRCPGACDFRPNGHLEADDATAQRSALVSGVELVPMLPAGACNGGASWSAGPCLPVAMRVDAPERATPGRFEASLVLTSPGDVVQGWSASVRANGCRIVSALLRNTASADRAEAPPGLRHLGYGVAQSVTGGAVTAVELSFTEDITLPAGGVTVMALTVEGQSASGCTPCALTVGDGLRWTGQPLTLTIAAGGYAYHPASATTVTQVCAP